MQYARNPANGYVEVAWSKLTWLWVLLAAPFYFALRGMWGWAVVSATPWSIAAGLVLGSKGGPLLVGSLIAAAVFNAPFAVAAKTLIRRHYGQAGWQLVKPREEAMGSMPEPAQASQSPRSSY